MFFNASLPHVNLITKTDFDGNLSSLNRKITSNKSKHLLVENKLKNLKIFDSSYFRGKNYFEEYGTQNYLVFQPMYKYLNLIVNVSNVDYIYYWKSKGLLDQRLNSIRASSYSVTPNISYYGTKKRVEFD